MLPSAPQLFISPTFAQGSVANPISSGILARCWKIPVRRSLKKSTVNSTLLLNSCPSIPISNFFAFSQRKFWEASWLSAIFLPLPQIPAPLPSVMVERNGKRVSLPSRSLPTIPYEALILKKLIKDKFFCTHSYCVGTQPAEMAGNTPNFCPFSNASEPV